VKGAAAYLGFRALAGLFGLLPEPVMRRGGQAMGWTLSWVARRKMSLLRRTMGRVVGPGPEADRLARRMFASYGRYWAEVFWVRPRRKSSIVAHAHISGIEHVEAAKATGRGIVLALPHLGNWEAAGAKAEAIGIPVLAVAESLPNRRITDWFLGVRNDMGIDIVLTGAGRRVTVELARRLEQGGTVALLADRDLSGRGVEGELFGERTTMPAGAVALAERTGAILLPVGCFFASGKGHEFLVRPPLVLPDGEGDRESRVAAGVQALARELEHIIREDPAQWHLFQPNWPSDREGRAS
jgi:KDO2-lipid IV(A) lauroyltransferase